MFDIATQECMSIKYIGRRIFLYLLILVQGFNFYVSYHPFGGIMGSPVNLIVAVKGRVG
jgi:hypothetical protein